MGLIESGKKTRRAHETCPNLLRKMATISLLVPRLFQPPHTEGDFHCLFHFGCGSSSSFTELLTSILVTTLEGFKHKCNMNESSSFICNMNEYSQRSFRNCTATLIQTVLYSLNAQELDFLPSTLKALNT